MTLVSTNGPLRRLMNRGFKAISPGMSLRPFLAILITAAMLFAPLAMGSEAAMASVPANHHGEAMESGHCGEQPENGKENKASDSPCCVAMCAAVAISPQVSFEPPQFGNLLVRPSPVGFEHGFLAELPTPPPRLA